MPRILWVEESKPADAAPLEALRSAGFDLTVGTPALPTLAAARPELVVYAASRGRGFLQQIRSAPGQSHLPVVLLSPVVDRQNLIASRLEGADDVLPLPADSALLLAVVATRLAQVARLRQALRAPAAATPAASAPPPPAPPPRPRPVPSADGPLNRTSFSERAAAAMRSAGNSARLAIRLVETGAGKADDSAIVGALRSVAHDGATAAQLAEDRYAVLMDAKQSVDGLRQRLQAVTGQQPGEIGSVELTGDNVPDHEMAKVMTHALRQFSRGQSAADLPATLDEVFSRSVEDAAVKLKQFRLVLERKAYHFDYQPIVRLTDRQIHHYEALLRLHGDGMTNTGEMIGFAEQVGLISRIDQAVLDTAFKVLWNRQTPADACFAINLSGLTVQSPAEMKTILSALSLRQEMNKRLQIELTESGEITDLELANNLVQQIRKLGYKVFLDDFGAGAASFQYLHALKVDGVKIDGRYVKHIDTSEKDATMLGGLVRLVKELGLKTVAEFVETEAQAKRLQELGVDYGQGWLFGKPQPQLGNVARRAS